MFSCFRCGRSLKEFPFNPNMSKEDYENLEKKVSEALDNLEGELKGENGTTKTICSFIEPHNTTLFYCIELKKAEYDNLISDSENSNIVENNLNKLFSTKKIFI